MAEVLIESVESLCVVVLLLCLSHWLLCRLTARKCPKCGSKWRTELRGEWGVEDWRCRRCDHWWTHEYETPTVVREASRSRLPYHIGKDN